MRKLYETANEQSPSHPADAQDLLIYTGHNNVKIPWKDWNPNNDDNDKVYINLQVILQSVKLSVMQLFAIKVASYKMVRLSSCRT
ncbi:13539_t:CDS:2 [Entrophospora sp. SA101]|nr:13539_t:CDS:2 [Entrophospora sp. SA101]